MTMQHQGILTKHLLKFLRVRSALCGKFKYLWLNIWLRTQTHSLALSAHGKEFHLPDGAKNTGQTQPLKRVPSVVRRNNAKAQTRKKRSGTILGLKGQSIVSMVEWPAYSISENGLMG